MKRITYICAILLSSVLMFSCSDYLEAPPSVDLDEDGVFADRTLTEQYITGIYAEGMPLGFSMGSSGIDRKLCATSTLAGACDEAEQGANWGKGNASWNVDNHNNSSIDWDEDPVTTPVGRHYENAISCLNVLTKCPMIRETLILRHVPEAKPILCGLWSSGKEYIDMVDCL